MNEILAEPVREKEIDSGEGDLISFGLASMQGWRDAQEDAHSAILSFDNNCSYFGVYDGHGGPEVAQFTSIHLPKYLKSSISWQQGNMERALRDGFMKFDVVLATDKATEELKELAEAAKRKQSGRELDQENRSAEKDSPSMYCGTTACVAVITDSTLYVANAGDSRCVLCRGEGAVELSRDHKPDDRKEKRRIKHAGAYVSRNGRVNCFLNLSRALGDHCLKQNPEIPLDEQAISPKPDIREEKLHEDDHFLVLGCDGIWDSMESQQVVDFIKVRLAKGMKPAAICEQLCDACLAKDMDSVSGFDNMTVIIVLLKKNRSQKNGDTIHF